MLQTFSMYIKPFEQERDVTVYLPRRYHDEDKSYPVLYMHDGQNVFEDSDAVGGRSLGLREFLELSGTEAIVVAIHANLSSEQRGTEYSPWDNSGETDGGKGEAYIDFIVDKLKPFIDQVYRTIPDQTSMAGISLGGLLSLYAACRYPHVFQKVACVSAYLDQLESLEQLILSSDLSALEKVYLDCGTLEGENAAQHQFFLESNQAIYARLQNKVENVTFDIIEGGKHEYTYFKERVPAVLSFFLDKDCRIRLRADDFTTVWESPMSL
ncbi:alpha/beta hydrolase [Priestia koreensis]|uniref:alpha/beta hydrolase n=1 Tax=Priestia koreensis TaxID=284581 RepID=UPI001F56C9FD|nr:alpha/beta fold hydrolase [Priestia koreensis]MCM3005167.1 alpha/beta fold hydrolase [Priestia koreensis]UNL83153.1 alpha/beta hydrolase [Priestia koreensis]